MSNTIFKSLVWLNVLLVCVFAGFKARDKYEESMLVSNVYEGIFGAETRVDLKVEGRGNFFGLARCREGREDFVSGAKDALRLAGLAADPAAKTTLRLKVNCDEHGDLKLKDIAVLANGQATRLGTGTEFDDQRLLEALYRAKGTDVLLAGLKEPRMQCQVLSIAMQIGDTSADKAVLDLIASDKSAFTFGYGCRYTVQDFLKRAGK